MGHSNLMQIYGKFFRVSPENSCIVWVGNLKGLNSKIDERF